MNFFFRRNSFNKMLRRIRKPFRRITTALRRRTPRLRIAQWWDTILEDGREILEYSQIEGFNHLANRRLHYMER